MGVSIQFQYTVNEIAEASKAGMARAKQQRKGVFGGSFAGWVLFVGLAIFFVYRAAQNQTSRVVAPTPPSRPVPGGSEMNAQLIPWAIILVVVLLLLYIRHTRRKGYAPETEVMRTLTADDNLLVFGNPLSRTEYKWEAFDSFEETANLLILYQHDSGRGKQVQIIPVPKRAFANPAQLAEFRQLLDSHVDLWLV